jgi:hypothetical protein
MSQPWYSEDDQTPEQIAAQLEQVRAGMSESDRIDLAAYMLDGIEPKQQPAAQAPAPAAQTPAAPTSAQILEGFKSGRHYRGDPDAGSAFLTAKPLEAGVLKQG